VSAASSNETHTLKPAGTSWRTPPRLHVREHGTENPGVGSSIQFSPCPPFLSPTKHHNPALGAAFRHFGSCKSLVMSCDPLGWFLTADWPPFDPPFPERRSPLWRGVPAANNAASGGSDGLREHRRGGLILHHAHRDDVRRVVSHLADVLAIRAAAGLGSTGLNPRQLVWRD
jgi:hypothetical protein